MNPRISKKRLIIVSLLILLFIVFFNNRSVQLDPQDEKYIQRFLNDWHISQTKEDIHKSISSEISFISRVQDSVISQIKHFEIPHQQFGNVYGYYINRKGQCYDRAILMEKIFSYYHFPFRHVYVYYGAENQQPSRLDFFKKGLRSHALVEVKTSKGWLTVGTNSNWLGIDSSGRLITVSELRKELVSNNLHLQRKPLIGFEPSWTREKDFRYIYGVYSRHGDFFKHTNQNPSLSSMQSGFHILPDYNLRMLFYNLTK